jgi:excisionase family DNA binding protein
MAGQQQSAQPGQPAASQAATAPSVMTLQEAADYLKVAIEDVLAMIEAGDIKAKKIGTQYRISKGAIDEFLAS